MSTQTLEKQTPTEGRISPGDFVWYELMTDDLEAAQSFYGPVLGWTVVDSGQKDRNYRIARAGEHNVGGMMAKALPPDARPQWVGYIAVEDVDATAEHLREKGGVLHKGPEEIPGVGRFAVVSDPQGAIFYLFRIDKATPPPRLPAHAIGAVGWRQLNATDGRSALEFYEGMFGWYKAQAYEMGPNMVYQTFSSNAEDPMTGGLMIVKEPAQRPGNLPQPAWTFFFNVERIQEAVDRVKAHGGTVKHGPVQVPGGRWIAECTDRQGGVFGMLSNH